MVVGLQRIHRNNGNQLSAAGFERTNVNIYLGTSYIHIIQEVYTADNIYSVSNIHYTVQNKAYLIV